MLCVLNSGIARAHQNMASDEKLLEELSGDPVLHLYDWERPSATFGHFIQPQKHFNLSAVEKHGLDLAKRPTGGGVVFHIWDYAFSFLMPASHPFFSSHTLENYRFVNEVVLDVVKEYLLLQGPLDLIGDSLPIQGSGCQNFCMARPTQYDVVYQGMKIAGAAQRKTKKGYLHQGTISLALPNEPWLREVLLDGEGVIRAMFSYSFAPFAFGSKGFFQARQEMGDLLTCAFRQRLK